MKLVRTTSTSRRGGFGIWSNLIHLPRFPSRFLFLHLPATVRKHPTMEAGRQETEAAVFPVTRHTALLTHNCPRCGSRAVLLFVGGRICRLVCGACAVVFDLPHDPVPSQQCTSPCRGGTWAAAVASTPDSSGPCARHASRNHTPAIPSPVSHGRM